MLEKDKLLRKIQMYDLFLVDLNLYLDSHPQCKEGFKCFKKYQDLSNKAREEYQTKYGPLSISSLANNADCWTWVNEPWPWEKGG